jgi:DNA polymerase-3 subunit alpha
MYNKEFCHLHVHSDFSTLDGFGSPEKFVKKAKSLRYTHLAITDHGNIDCAIRFQRACEKEGIRHVFGCELYIDEDRNKKGRDAKRFHLNCFVKNQKGWRNLMRLLTVAHLEGMAMRPRIDPDILLEHCEGLILTTACCGGFINTQWGMKLFKRLEKKLGDDLYLEVMPHELEQQHEYNLKVLDLADKYDLKVIATNDCHYVNKDDSIIQEQLLCIQRADVMSNPKRFKFTVDGLYLCDAQTLENKFLDNCEYMDELEIKRYMRNTMEVAKKCEDFRLEQKPVHLPLIEGVEAENEDAFFETLIWDGLDKKIDEEKIKKSCIQKYEDRINDELDILLPKGFTRYFLIVWELLNWCKKNDISIGPGRGSVGGCLIAWLIGITSVDPLKYDLLFSRFISPERNDLPDIDIDFDVEKREDVKEHLKKLYGRKNVASVSTFLTMKAAGSLQDLSRIYEIPKKEINAITKALQLEDNEMLSEEFFDSHEDDVVADFWREEPDICLDAIELQGTIKAYGKHAAGICISQDDLSLSDNCYLVNRNNDILCNWDKDDIEYMGLMKLDILGLGCLSRNNVCLKMIEENHNIKIDLEDLELNDEEVFHMLSKGYCTGVFQLGSWGLTKFCKKLGIESFKDIYNATALFRPGPLRTGIAKEFIDRKKEGKWKKVHALYDQITEETNGVIIYQEQIMLILNELAGISWARCDKIRKMISKSKGADALSPFKKEFVNGCVDSETIDKKTAEGMFDDIVEFGAYCFNKSHAVEYSVLSYWDAWLKHHYPAEFIAACLSFISGSDEKSLKRQEDLLQRATEQGLKVSLPKVGISKALRWNAHDGKLIMPFKSIDGIGEKSAEAIIKETNKKRQGFFESSENYNLPVKVKKILKDIKAYDKTEVKYNDVKKLKPYFKFNLYKILGF